MAKQVIHKDGEDQVVREDFAKKHRGLWWAFFSIVGFILIMLVLFLGGVIKLGMDPEPEAMPSPTPADTERAVP